MIGSFIPCAEAIWNIFFLSMKPLRFLHVSKTGGQAISIITHEQSNHRWGLLDNGVQGKLCHRLISNNDRTQNSHDYDWFMVVRNPYDRLLSEYNWHIQWHKEVIDLNTYLQRELSTLPSNDTLKGAHFTEQYRYLEDGYTIHILRFENLEQEFNQLMKDYGYSIVLNKKINVSDKHCSMNDLTLETIQLINRVYEKDFLRFGYHMIDCL